MKIQMTKPCARAVFVLVTTGVLNGLALAAEEPAQTPSGKLLVYCAGGMQRPVETLARQFEAETGVKVELTFANSGQLLGQIKTTRTGDVYIPGEIGFAEQAKAEELIAGEPVRFCYFVPVIYVRKGNPKGIRTLADLQRPGLRLALADPSAALGPVQVRLFRKHKLDEAALQKNTVATPATVTDVALAVKMGTVDAGIVWDAFGNFAPDEAEAVPIPLEDNVISEVSACVLASSKNPATARAFVEYLVSEQGRKVLKEQRFTVERPVGRRAPESSTATGTTTGAVTLLVHVGGTMRPAMEELCRLFERETGVKVELNYNDSGSLMTVIETTGKGDICVVHDPFPGLMEKKGWVDRTYIVASLTPVIVVPKGNPKQIKGVRDLARADVRLALTDAIYSTGGHIVSVIFKKAGLEEAIARKDVVRARAGGEVANAVKLGTVDAAIVWNAVAYARRDALEAIPIESNLLPDAKVDAVTTATYGVIDLSCTKVGLMILKNSRHLDLARKLAELAVSERGRAIWTRLGYSPAPAASPTP